MPAVAAGFFLTAPAGQGGCSRATVVEQGRQQRQPSRAVVAAGMTIDRDFTGWRDFDEKPGVDGLEVHIRLRDLDRRPIAAAGRLMIELYSFRPASADHADRRLELWDVSLNPQETPAAYWNRATELYDVRLALSEATRTLDAGEKCVLVVTYRSPQSTYWTDELVLALPMAKRLLTSR